MRINLYLNGNTNRYATLKSSYPNNQLKNINITNKNYVTFGHWLDDELAEKKRALGKVDNKISYAQSQIREKKEKNDAEITRLNHAIQKEQENNNSLATEIKKLSGDKEQKEKNIKAIKSDGVTTEKKIAQGKQRVEQIKHEVTQTLNTINEINNAAAVQKQEKLSQARIQTQEKLMQNLENTLSNPRHKLIQGVVAPLKLQKKGVDVQIPNGILFEADSREVSMKVFEWLAKKTNSNYLILEANELSSNDKLAKSVMKAARKAKQIAGEGKRTTFTFIDNFEHCVPSRNANNTLVGFFKDFLDTCAKDYNNIIVASTTRESKLDPIVSAIHRFPIRIKLDTTFLRDQEYGYKALLNEIEKLSTNGDVLKINFIDFLFNNTKKILRNIK